MKSPLDEYQVFVKPVGSSCNLACDYCYYNGEKAGNRLMSRELLGLYVKQHIDYCRDDSLLFTWHGGEPLLAGLDFFEDVVSLQQKYNRESKQIVNGIQTNGTLIDNRWARFFLKHGFIIGLSLDGPERFHNRFRRNFSGENTYSRVMQAWKIVKEHGIKHELLCVVNSDNVESPLDIYNFFRENGVENLTFIPLVEKRGERGVSERSVDPGKYGHFLKEIFEQWKSEDIGKIKIQIIEEALRSAFKQEHTLCIFRRICGGVPVIELNGDFFTCDHYVNEENRVGTIVESSLGDLLNSEMQLAFGRKKELLPPFCLKCEVLEMCNGGCPKNRFALTPEGDEGLNYLCSGYKSFFTHCKPFVEKVAKVWQTKQDL